VGHAVLVSLLTVLSRITGLLRDAVLAAVFGMGVITDAFFLGFLVPNLFRRLFGEGALSAAFIPVYSDRLRKDRLSAQRLASLCLAIMLVVLGTITLIGEASLAWLAANVSDDTALAIRLTMIMLPYMPLICLVAVIGGMLQVHGRFGPPAAVPIVMNLTLIAGAFLATVDLYRDAALRHCIVVVAACVLVAGMIQLAWQVLAVLEVETFTACFAGAGTAMHQVVRAMLPMMVGLAVFQINAFLDSLIAWGLSPAAPAAIPLGMSPETGETPMLNFFGAQIRYPLRTGSVAALHWSQRLYQFPLGVFGIAIATAIYPALVRAAPPFARADGRFEQILRQGLRLAVFIGLPASVGLLLVRLPLTRLVYEHGHFTPKDVHRVAQILAGYGCAVWAYSMTHVLTRAFYAVKDTVTPMKISVLMVGLNLLLNLILIWYLGAAGLAWSTAICAVVQVIILVRAVAGHVAHPVDADVWRAWGRSVCLTGVMAGALGVLTLWIKPADLDPIASGIVLLIMVALGAAVYLGGAWFVGADELKWLSRAKRGAE
jgi:putative peptidoglycan lipid II flippase